MAEDARALDERTNYSYKRRVNQPRAVDELSMTIASRTCSRDKGSSTPRDWLTEEQSIVKSRGTEEPKGTGLGKRGSDFRTEI